MKTQSTQNGNRGAAFALVMVLVFTAVAVLIMASTLGRTATTSTLNQRNNQYTASIYAAEAATETVVARMKADYLAGSLSYVTNDLSTYRAYIPSASEDPYWSGFRFSDGQGNVNRTYVEAISGRSWGPLQSQYAGLNGWTNTYRVVSNVTQTNEPYTVSAAVQQDLQLVGIPVFQFAIFYNSLLEFTWAATMTVNGRTHANTNIFLGSSKNLTFNSVATSVGTITSPAWFGKTKSQYTGNINFNGSPGYSTNANALTLPVGTNNAPEVVHEIVYLPPSNEDPNSAMGQQRFFNKAGLILLVSNNTVNLTLRTSPGDSQPTNLVAFYSSTNYAGIVTNFPFLSVSNSFYDQRESKTVLVTDINVGKLKSWLVTNGAVNWKFPNNGGTYDHGVFPNILYVADNRPGSSSVLPAVRLYNGAVIPTNTAPSGLPTGFTVATANPLYVKGDYNNPSGNQSSTDTSKTFPASLISDALTILSSQWVDSQSTYSLSSGSKNDAVSTTVNAAILSGVVYSTGDDVDNFSGGVMNLPRLLEDWGNSSPSVVLTLNTSIVNFFNSTRATAQFQEPGVYYYAPTRIFSFDQNFTNEAKLPPGTPMLGVIQRTKWAVPPPNVITYAGN
jgi:hypothetical protein